MAINASAYSLLTIGFLALGLVLSSIATSSCKLVKRNLQGDFNLKFGLFTFLSYGETNTYQFSEKCEDDWEDYEFDGAHKTAQAFGIMTPIWTLLVLIMVSVGVFCVKLPRNLHIVTSSLIPFALIFQLVVFTIYSSDGCIGTPYEFLDAYDESTPFFENKFCEPEEGTYYVSVVL